MQSLETKPFFLDIHSITLRITHEEFEKLYQDNPDVQLERAANGELITMAPVGLESGNKELDLGSQLYVWNKSTRLGKAFSSSTTFTLPHGSQGSPDAAWVKL